MMDDSRFSRRNVVKGIASSVVLGAAGLGEAAAADRRSVFVHGSEPTAAVRDHGGQVRFDYDNFDFIAARVPDVAALRRDGRVSDVTPDGTVEAIHHRDGHDGGPGDGGGGGDDGSSSQTLPWGVDRIDAEPGAVSADGTGVDVAVLDTGVDTGHPDLSVDGGANCTGKGNGYEDKDGHGTHCAGIATAVDNGEGVVGVAPGASLWAVKVLDNSGSGAWSNVICGIDWCLTNGKEIISMSLGATSMPDEVGTAISDAYSAGHLLVAAAGNRGNDQDGDDEEENVDQPARHPDVVAVSAMTGDADGSNSDDVIASYSSVGSEVEVMAPGTDVYSTYKGGGYETLSGTSMACPHVSGLAALVWDGDNGSARETLQTSAEPIETVGVEQGAGLVDAEAATSSS